ncbi:MAG: sulfate adenylyltransferase subunit CysN [Acidobacteria bacterium]|nr:sulfate adenylyltransferase subunit CysN [Acidobacteriota bacterium]
MGIEEFLRLNEEKELLRLSTAGSVDDGKSTLIGRLLFDSKGVYEDQIASARKASVNQSAGPLDFSLLTDGLRAEREQGITIDVAYRYFSTPRRKFIIADTPGHEQYTRNMATGASTAHLAVILIDARNGVLPQSRRHAYIASLLGIPRVVAAVNKMDLMEFRQEVFERIREEFAGFCRRLEIRDPEFIPISALLGDNVVEKSANTPWYAGPSLLEYLETVPIPHAGNLADFRFPVQTVIRPDQDFRGFAGQIASGVVRAGDAVMVLPSGRASRVASIATYDGDLRRAWAPMAVTLCLEDEIDISRGDMLVHPRNVPQVGRHIEAQVVWMNARPLRTRHPYLIKHTTHVVKGTVAEIHHKVDVNTLDPAPAAELELNEIGAITLETHRPLFFDAYARNRVTGSFILIDPMSNETVGAGMIRQAAQTAHEAEGPVTTAEREERYGHRAATVWLAGSLELAGAVERKLFDRGHLAHLAPPRGLLAMVLNQAGVIAICPVETLEPEVVDRAREIVGAERFAAVDAAALGEDVEAAARAVCRLLEERGIIPAQGEKLEEGGGI